MKLKSISNKKHNFFYFFVKFYTVKNTFFATKYENILIIFGFFFWSKDKVY